MLLLSNVQESLQKKKKCRKIERVEMHVGKDIIFALSEFVEHTK